MSTIGQGAQTYRLWDAKVVFFGSQMDIKDWYILNVVTYALLKCLTSWNKGIIFFFSNWCIYIESIENYCL